MSEWFSFVEHPTMFRNSLLLSIPCCAFLARIIFHDWDGFWYSFRMSIRPDLISFFRGEWIDDQWETIKFYFFLVLCVATVAGIYSGTLWWFFERGS
jgi:hypothetical protein